MWGKRGVLFAFRFFGMTCRSLRGGEVFVHVFFVFRLLCILPVCFVAFRPLIYLCSFIKKKKKKKNLLIFLQTYDFFAPSFCLFTCLVFVLFLIFLRLIIHLFMYPDYLK